MKIYKSARLLSDTDRRFFTAAETAWDAVERICRAKAPVPRPGTPYHTCPTCGGLLTEKYEHCPHCGQKILHVSEGDSDGK